MVNINLLSEGRKPAVARRQQQQPGFVGRDEDALGRWSLFGLIVLGALAFGGYWYMLHSTITQLDTDIAAAQKEVDELAPIIREVEHYKAKKAELQHKIQIINELKANQRGPVRIMDQISRALPELLWLDRMRLRGHAVTLSGHAFNTSAVANFIDNLDSVPEFAEPVLKDTRQQRGVYSFTITFNYTSTPTQQAADESDQAAAGEADAGDGE
jgi:type IV pilus assembly protein PilN